MRRFRYALQRKSGYISPYTLGMVYPSYRKGLILQGPKGLWVAPVLIMLPIGPRLWFRIWPAAIRFPSWIARTVNRRNLKKFLKR